MTQTEFETLYDLWNGAFDFETAVLMAGIPEQYVESARITWDAWQEAFEA